ncbi:MAG: CpXC domain-containing protein [Anaerolineae bacterium]
MAISFSQTAQLNCPQCKAPFTTEVWLIVDAGERPDLAARCTEGTIHVITCPNGHQGMLAAPLLYHDRSKKQLLLALAPGMDRKQSQEAGGQLIGQLKSKLLILPGSEYLDAPQAVPSELLPAAIAGKLEEAIAQAQAEIENNPTLSAALRLLQDNQTLAQTLQEWITAGDWDRSKTMLQEHLELLTDDAERVFGALLDLAHLQGDVEGVHVLSNRHDLLAAARRDGIDAAYAQYPAEDGAETEAQAELESRMRELGIQSQADLERAVQEHPELRELIERAMVEENPMLQALAALLQAGSPEQVQETLRDYPILSSDEAIQAIRAGIANARSAGQEEMAQHIEQQLDLLMQLKGDGAATRSYDTSR